MNEKNLDQRVAALEAKVAMLSDFPEKQFNSQQTLMLNLAQLIIRHSMAIATISKIVATLPFPKPPELQKLMTDFKAQTETSEERFEADLARVTELLRALPGATPPAPPKV